MASEARVDSQHHCKDFSGELNLVEADEKCRQNREIINKEQASGRAFQSAASVAEALGQTSDSRCQLLREQSHKSNLFWPGYLQIHLASLGQLGTQ